MIEMPVAVGRSSDLMALAGNCSTTTQPQKIMKLLIPMILAAFVLVGCDQQKAAIDDNATVTKSIIDQEKKDVNAAAVAATKQAETDALVEKAKIEQNKLATQAQLNAEKVKADAQAEFEKAKLDAAK
jgi:PBP1b-binding outer membrane lipoprotein LpoB